MTKIKLTKPQKIFLDSLKEESKEDTEITWIQVFPEEIRTAKALERKGVIEMNGDYEARIKE